MKNFKILPTFPRTVMAFLLLPILLIFTACANDDGSIGFPDLDDDDENLERLVAWFSGYDRSLFIMKEDIENVMIHLNADMMDPGRIVFMHPGRDGVWRLVFATIRPFEEHNLMVRAIEQHRSRIERLEQATAPAADRFLDSQTYYGKECQEVPPTEGTCHVIGDESSQTWYPKRNKCRTTENIRSRCTEYFTKDVGESRVFANRSCTGSYRVRALLNDWLCR